MKVALIPPIPNLEEFGKGDFHLVLSHLLDIPEYFNHYQEQADGGAFIILDNSAHELGEGKDPVHLMEQALDLGAKELVCPDALFDSKRSIELTTKALKAYSKLPDFEVYGLRLMIVPQGEDAYQWGLCLQGMLEAYKRYTPLTPLTIGISKDYEKWSGGVPHLLSSYVDPLRDIYDFETHLLGWGRQLHVLSTLATRYPWIRSTDSAKPLVYACHNLQIDLTLDNPEYPGRMENYFQFEMTWAQIQMAWENIKTFRSRARGEY